jgi:hypothetical protein
VNTQACSISQKPGFIVSLDDTGRTYFSAQVAFLAGSQVDRM